MYDGETFIAMVMVLTVVFAYINAWIRKRKAMTYRQAVYRKKINNKSVMYFYTKKSHSAGKQMSSLEK